MNEGLTVLLAEDEILKRIPIKDFLEDEHFQVILAENADEVLKYGPKADALIVDVRLPSIQGLEGIEAVARLIERGLPPQVPIIFISVLSEKEEICQHKLKELAIPQGRYIWLQRPFELELLVKFIQDELAVRDR